MISSLNSPPMEQVKVALPGTLIYGIPGLDWFPCFSIKCCNIVKDGLWWLPLISFMGTICASSTLPPISLNSKVNQPKDFDGLS